MKCRVCGALFLTELKLVPAHQRVFMVQLGPSGGVIGRLEMCPGGGEPPATEPAA